MPDFHSAGLTESLVKFSKSTGRLTFEPALHYLEMKKSKKKPSQTAAMRIRIEEIIRSIPRGKVSTYGAIAKTAGYARAARIVASVLRRSYGLPWQRVLGAGGEIKLRGDSAIEQRLRLEAEGVRFRGRRVDMKLHEFRTERSKERNIPGKTARNRGEKRHLNSSNGRNL